MAYDINRIDEVTDEHLATYVDEYVKRVIAKARRLEYNEAVTVTVYAYQYRRDEDYDIEHKVSVGNYPKEQKADGNNAMRAIVRAVMAWEVEKADKPTNVTVMLPAPSPDVEDAEFEAI